MGALLGWLHDVVALLARTLFTPILLVAVLAWGFGFVLQAVALFTGDLEVDMVWQRLGQLVGVDPLTLRIGLLGPVHVIWVGALLPRFWRAEAALGVRWGTVVERLGARLGGLLEGLLTLLVTLVLLPFVFQPQLVAFRFGADAWWERLGNLVDGTASHTAVAAVWGTYRRWSDQPVPGKYSVPPSAIEWQGLDGGMMARWDPLLTASTVDSTHFAQTKAFMWVESAGRQYAVSQTGCGGLMQFCVSTAQRQPFRRIFGTGTVFACDCGGKPCALPRAVQDDLETDKDALITHAERFPCEPTDARFDPARAIPAGAAFTTELSEQVGGNLYLMYIGYNSGPAVSKKLHAIVGSDATLEEIRPHLAPVLQRWYGTKAVSRANGLLDTHLPKLRRAYEHYGGR